MARKTKKEKLLAEIRRLKVIAKQKEVLGKSLNYSLKKEATVPIERDLVEEKLPDQKDEVGKKVISEGSLSIKTAELSPILKDLRKIIFLTVTFLSLQIILYLTLLRNL